MNKSYSYLAPLVNQECKIDGDFYIAFKDSFIIHNDNDGVLVMSYEFNDNPLFNEYMERLHENPLFLESYMEDEDIFIVLKFPDSFKYEYHCYKEGKFSKFRESAKMIIIEYMLKVHETETCERIRKVLYRDPILRKQIEEDIGWHLDELDELSSKPILENETCYNIATLKNKV